MIIKSMKKMKNCKCKELQVPEMQRMCNAVRMSRELKERELIEKAKQGEQEALLCLYEKYLPLFKKLCRNRADYSNVLEVDDLLQECFIALKLAVKRYSFDAESSFKTYLFNCIKWHLYRVTVQLAFVPEYQLQMIIKIKKFREDYEKKYGHKPDNGLVMHEFYISGDCLRELDVLKDLKVTSIDVPIGEDGENTLKDLLPGVDDLEERVVKRLSVVQLWESLESCLLQEELKIIKMIYLDRLTFKEISEITGRSETNVRTVQERSLKKLRMRQKLKDIL